MKYILSQILLLALFLTNGFAQSKMDSLLQVAIKQTGREKLETLRQATLIMDEDASAEKAIENLLHSAQQQGDDLYLAAAYNERGYNHFHKVFKSDSIKKTIDKGFEALKRVDDKRLMYAADKAIYDRTRILLNQLLVVQYIEERNFVFALKLLNDFLEATKNEKDPKFKRYAYLQLGLINRVMGNGKEAIENYTGVLKYNNIDNSDRHILVTAIASCGTLDAYLSLKDYESGIALANTLMQNFTEDNSRLYYVANLTVSSGDKQLKRLNVLFRVNRYYAYHHISKNEMEKAKEYLDKCDEQFSYLHRPAIPLYYELKAYYYWKLKKYDLAYQNITKITEKIGSHPRTSQDLTYFVMQADILDEWGKKEESYKLLKQTYVLNDSINRNDIKSQIVAMESIQKVTTLESELELQVAKIYTFRVVLIGGSFCIILILTILFVIWKNNNKLRERNKNLYKLHQKALEICKEIDDLKEENNLLKEKPDPQQFIISKLDAYMKKSQAYLDPHITRDQIASELGTNRQYLADAIREKRIRRPTSICILGGCNIYTIRL